MPDLGRSPRRDPSKRNSITNRLLGSFNKARQETTASIQRRASSANKQSPQSPLSRIREWLDTCNREHDHHCSSHSSSANGGAIDVATFHPVWLIDSAERCLVKAKPTDRYVALSYAWGAQRNDGLPPPPVLVKANVDVFEDVLPDEDLPQTIVDAMRVSRKLGLRYLWVDKLCIVQDDENEKEMHIRNMPYVFSNAYLTIIAACGDVYTGLTPVDSRRPARDLAPGTQVHEELLRKSKWHTRGWTLQEHLYSRRCVFFFEDAITWQCHCELWQGSPTGLAKSVRGRRESCLNPLSSAVFGYRHAPWPDLDEYARIAMDYSARRVTSVDETMKAFCGVTNILTRIFPNGFMYGMPLMFLDIALLWRPQASIRRRAPSRPPPLPSWSWMGWWFDGIPADMILWRAAADYVEEAKTARQGQKSNRLHSPFAFKIKPTVTWNLTDNQAVSPVPNNGLQLRDLRSRRQAAAQVPAGWSREGSHFKHDSDDVTIFRYPIPVEDPPEPGEYPPPTGEMAFPGPFLRFRTMSAFFEVDYDATMSPRDADMNPPVAIGNIWSKDDRWAGSLRSHDGWLGIQSSNYHGDEVLEFIAISSATERRGSHVFTEEQFMQQKDANDFIDIVNVLWIERIGPICYRRGLGHILQKAWDAQQKNEVEILLG